MSSPVSPILNLDVDARRAERRIAIAILVSTPIAVTLLQQSTWVLATVVATTTAVLVAGFRAAGWLGGAARIVGIACGPDGRWMLRDAAGRVSERTLAGSTRVTPFAIWLRWRGHPRSLLLVPGDIPTADFRRLVVRLRLGDRLIPGGSNE
jgi:hypothetical protein